VIAFVKVTRMLQLLGRSSAALAVKKLLGDIPANIKVNGSHGGNVDCQNCQRLTIEHGGPQLVRLHDRCLAAKFNFGNLGNRGTPGNFEALPHSEIVQL
jgi:hypothetical protein